MEPDVVAIRGDGIDRPFFRDGTGGANATILVDCRTHQVEQTQKDYNERTLSSVDVSLAGQAVAAGLVSETGGVGTFSAVIDISASAGELTGTVTAEGDDYWEDIWSSDPPPPVTTHWTVSEAFTATVRADLAGPTITVLGLDPQDGLGARQTIRLDVTDAGAGVRRVTWELPGASERELGRDGNTYRAEVDWRAATGTSQDAPCPPGFDVTIRARDQAMPVGNETTVTLPLRDAVAPAISIDTPEPDAELPNDGSGATVSVKGSVTDAWSGVARLEISLDDGQPIDLRPGMPVVRRAEWAYAFRIPDFGHHRVTVRAVDVAGNAAAPATVRFEIAAPLAVVEHRDPFGLGSYLSDLLDFAGRSLTVPHNPQATLTEQARRRLLAVEIGRVFRQPVLRVAGAPDSASGVARNAVRAGIEVLQRVLDATGTNLVAHWPLTEAAGPTAEDATGNGFTARARSGSNPTWIPGRGGATAVRLNGVDDELIVDGAGALTMRDAFSVAAWVRAEGSGTTGDFAIIVNKESEYELGRSLAGELGVAVANSSPGWNWVLTGIPLPVGEWVHVALTYDAGVAPADDRGRLLCYRNGRLAFRRDTNGLLGTGTPSLQDMRLGGRQWAVARFDGLLSDVRVYRGAVPAAAIARLAGVQPTLQACWTLDHGAGTVDHDSVSGRELALVGATWQGGRAGTALAIGAGQHARVTNMAGIRPGADDADFAMAAWILLEGSPTSARRAILQQGADSDRTVEVFLAPQADAVGVRARVGPNTTDGPAELVPLTARRWTHLACVKEGDRLVLYVDGVVRLRHRLAAPVAGTDGPLVIGTPAADGFVGRVEDLRIYDTALTGPEVAALVTSPEVGRRSYLRAAYHTLLQLNGTSYDELRLIRNADQDRRVKLAARLGIALTPGRPDELDALLRPSEAITERWLEETFGLTDTARDPLTTPALPKLVGWRQAALRRAWQEQDLADLGGVPLVDPTFVEAADLVDPVRVGALLATRRAELEAKRAELIDARTQAATPADGFAAAVEAGLAVPVDRLLALRTQRDAGTPIKSELAALQLTPRSFDRLLLLHDLAAAASVDAGEWAELDNLLVEAFRRGRRSAWRKEELDYLGGRPIVLSPDHFQLREGAIGGLEPELLDARLDWEERLASRVEQDSAVTEANAATLAEADGIVLPILRDALVPAARRVLGVPDSDGLSQHLLLDAAAGSSITTPARQAIELVGGMVFSLRTGRIDRTHPAGEWSIPDLPGFDADWPWMAAFEAWQAAMVAFFYPENLINPALRQANRLRTDAGPTPFGALIGALRRRDGSVAVRVADALKAYTQQRAKDPAIPDSYTPDPALADRHRELNDAVFNNPQELSVVVVQEVLYFVPLAVALQLHRWGAYPQALDWFRLVYDDAAPLERRAVYAGLRVERNTPPTRSRLDDWLRDLNPHSLASSQGGNPYTRFTVMALARCLLDFGDSEFTRETPESLARARALYLTAQELLRGSELRDPPAGALVLLPNPALEVLAQRVDNQLRKLREGRNIAGMKRPVEPVSPGTSAVPASPTVGSNGRIQPPSRLALRPTGHRYQVLVERARRLVALSGQVEAAYLAALERQDTETYREIEAGHHLELANRGVELQRLRVTQARNNTELARRRQSRVRVLQRTYGEWLDEGLNSWETATLAAYVAGGVARATAIGLQAAASIAQAAMSVAAAGTAAGAVTAPAATFGTLTVLGAVASGVASAADTTAQVSSLQASYERRRDEWELQQGLANQDYLISEQEIQLAGDQEQISAAEAGTAELQRTQSAAVATYLATRFLNRELYEWMSGVLADVYAYFLQQATATALLAQQQLAFERQLPPVGFIKEDYWVADAADSGGTATTDRRGLTGSVRLLQDLEELDQYAFEHDERKLNLIQSFSLASLAPFEFQQFRSSGVLPFSTPMGLFDRAFPGHYLRLIKRVRISVIALVPPVHGIKATLTASGVSRVVVGGDSFQEVVIRRDPEQVALTSPSNATGVFELDPQTDLLGPFEAMGVHTSWEFQLPRPANPFDFGNIADVLMTIEYTALASDDYRRQVIAGFDRRVAADLAVRLSSDRPDQWYQLYNPGAAERPYAVRFDLSRPEFPPNIDDLAIAHVLLAVVRTDGTGVQLEVDLQLRPAAEEGTTGPFGGSAASTPDGMVSTRRATGSAWLPMIGRTPVGIWELSFAGSIAPLVESGELGEVLLVVSFTGIAAPWPP